MKILLSRLDFNAHSTEFPGLLKPGMDSGEKVRRSQIYFCAAKTVQRTVELFPILTLGTNEWVCPETGCTA